MFKKILLILIFLMSSGSAFSAQVAITIDDFSIGDEPLLTIEERDKRILEALRKYKVKAGVFVTTRNLQDPRRKLRLEQWDRSGHLIANHTHTHRNYDRTDFSEYKADILKADSILGTYQNFHRLIRFPFLKMGKTVEQRDRMRAFLNQQGYKNGYVTIDNSEWFIDSRLIARLRKNKNVDLKPYKKFFLEHVWDRSQYYNELSKKTFGREPKHTLLLHHTLITALFLEDLILMYQKKGWRLIGAHEAFDDPIYSKEPNALPAGESIVWSLARAAGDSTLRYPGEDSQYEEDRADELGL